MNSGYWFATFQFNRDDCSPVGFLVDFMLTGYLLGNSLSGPD